MSAKPALYLAVDGGGTGCRARLEDAEGRVLGLGLGGPASTRLGAEACYDAIMMATRSAFAEAGLAEAAMAEAAAGLGIAGLSSRPIVRADLEGRIYPFAECRFASDSITACIGAHDGGYGGIVIVGTGSSGIARLERGEVQVGGCGFPLSDEGSGAFIGLRALSMTTRALDGRVEETPLLTDVLDRFERDRGKIVAWMDAAGATQYATFAPTVVRHAMDGEVAARAIMQEAAAGIEEICRALIQHDPPRLSLIGGLGSVIEPWLPPDLRARLRPVLGDALDGAAILAGRSARGLAEPESAEAVREAVVQ